MPDFNPRDPGQQSNDDVASHLGSLGFKSPAEHFNFYRFDEFGPYGDGDNYDWRDIYTFTPVDLSSVRLAINPIGYTQSVTNYRGSFSIFVVTEGYSHDVIFLWDGGTENGSLSNTGLGTYDVLRYEDFDNYQWIVPVQSGKDVVIMVVGLLEETIPTATGSRTEYQRFSYRIDIMPDTGAVPTNPDSGEGSTNPDTGGGPSRPGIPGIPVEELPPVPGAGSEGNDEVLFGLMSERDFDGRNGIDLVSFKHETAPENKRAAWDIKVIDGVLTVNAYHRFPNVERFQFDDIYVAFDLDGNAGIVARLLGAVFGKQAVGNPFYAGIGLELLDDGMSAHELAELALQAAEIAGSRNIVTALWTNVIGSAPSEADMQPFLELLDNGMTPGELTLLAANTDFNAQNIDLAGLASTGLDYWI